MAVQNLIEQHVIFISQDGSLDTTAILSNTLVQSLANNSAGKDLVTSVQFFQHWDGTNWTDSGFFEIKCYVSAAFQTTVQQNIPNLQAAFPQYQVVTWGGAVSFGN